MVLESIADRPPSTQAVRKRLVARCRAAVGVCGFDRESSMFQPL